jgi:hypothetical protein
VRPVLSAKQKLTARAESSNWTTIECSVELLLPTVAQTHREGAQNANVAQILAGSNLRGDLVVQGRALRKDVRAETELGKREDRVERND